MSLLPIQEFSLELQICRPTLYLCWNLKNNPLVALSVQQAACQSLNWSKPSSSPKNGTQGVVLSFLSPSPAPAAPCSYRCAGQDHRKALFPKDMQLVWNLINKKLSISGEKRIWQSSPGVPRQLQRIPGRRNYLEGKLCILLFSPAASMALPTQVIPCPSLYSSCLLQMACVVSCGTQRLWFPLHAL